MVCLYYRLVVLVSGRSARPQIPPLLLHRSLSRHALELCQFYTTLHVALSFFVVFSLTTGASNRI